jgi:hypothetical protein
MVGGCFDNHERIDDVEQFREPTFEQEEFGGSCRRTGTRRRAQFMRAVDTTASCALHLDQRQP